MERSKVVRIGDYRGRRPRGEKKGDSGAQKPLPDAGHLWELLDRNISIEIWKKGI